MASDPTSECAHDSMTAPANDMLSSGAASSELPFLVTHWLANYRVLGGQGTGDRQRDEAIERLRNAASEMATAFSAVGAYGTSSLVSAAAPSSPLVTPTSCGASDS